MPSICNASEPLYTFSNFSKTAFVVPEISPSSSMIMICISSFTPPRSVQNCEVHGALSNWSAQRHSLSTFTPDAIALATPTALVAGYLTIVALSPASSVIRYF